jgi:hypothetical protein
MKEGMTKPLRGRSLGTRLSEDEYTRCEKAAARRGQTLSEWCRRVLLEASQENTADDAGQLETLATLAEILALRKIVINLLYGEKAGEPLDEERMRELIETADAEKLAKAAERLRAARQTRAEGSSDGALPRTKSSG